ncbi:MAG TPA: glycosyltransferase family 2 protein [Kiritimatiellia bacterium]|nr:glycosyltransferase family 2 protein [Kiritimatiellia bacterium]
MSATRVTALVPAWNAEPFIEATLDSLARQDHANLRVVISVDVSTDRTAEVCAAFAARDSRFSVIRQATRRGWVGNVNALLREVNDGYCFFAFHDDLLDPPYVRELAARLDANPGAVVAFSDMDTLDRAGVRKTQVYEVLEGVIDPVERARRLLLKQGFWWVPHRGLFRVSVGREIGGLKKHLAGEFSADWPWMLHLALRGEFVRVPEVWVHKRYMKFSLSRTWKFSSPQAIAVILSCFREVLRARVPWPVKRAVLPVVFDRLGAAIRHMAMYRADQLRRWLTKV